MKPGLLKLVSIFIIFQAFDLFAEDWMPKRIIGMRYPPLAAQSRSQGTVSVKCVIGTDGSVTRTEIVSAPLVNELITGPRLLIEAAQKNAAEWKFVRKGLGNDLGSFTAVIKYTFKLEPSSKGDKKFKHEFVFEYPDLVTITSEEPIAQY